jgi:hypothetical protein
MIDRRSGSKHVDITALRFLLTQWGHEMSIWPLQVLSSGIAGSRVEAVRAPQRASLRPPFWLLLAGIIVIGIGIGLFAASITAILLSGSAAEAADPAGGSVPPHPPTPLTTDNGLHLYKSLNSVGLDTGTFALGGRFDEF